MDILKVLLDVSCAKILWPILGISVGIYVFFSEIRKKNRSIDKNDSEPDWQKSVLYFWITAPAGFIVAVASVYDANTLQHRWFLDCRYAVCVMYATCDLAFGISISLIILWCDELSPISIRRNIETIWNNIYIKIWRYQNNSESNIAAWDRFDPRAQAKYLEKFLSRHPNESDKKSLEFWNERINDTESKGYNYRIYLSKEDLIKLTNILPNFQDLDGLSIEFWKDKDGNFKIRHTKKSTDSLKGFSYANDEEKNELMPLVKKWYKTFKKQ